MAGPNIQFAECRIVGLFYRETGPKPLKGDRFWWYESLYLKCVRTIR